MCGIPKPNNIDVNIYKTTPRDAPLATPVKYGSANGFLKYPCINIPDSAIAIPDTIAPIVLKILNFPIILSLMALPVVPLRM